MSITFYHSDLTSELNYSNANARLVFDVLGMSMEDGGGEIQVGELDASIRKILRAINSKFESIPTRMGRGSVRLLKVDGVPTISRGPVVIEFGIEDSRIISMLREVLVFLQDARRASSPVMWC